MKNINIKFSTNKEEYFNDYMDVIRAFYPYVLNTENGDELFLELFKGSDLSYECIIKDYKNKENNSKLTINLEQNMSELEIKSKLKRYSKIALYDVLSKSTGRILPYGSLTGIRPTKLFHQLANDGIDAEKYFINDLRVSKEKTSMIRDICTNQEKYYSYNESEIDLFVNIPICVSRCSYCSFLSAELGKIKKSVQPYCDLLVEDICRAKALIKKLNLKVRTIYVGGGTPTSLSALQLNSILVQLSSIDCCEFTVEAGRPDTIDLDKLKCMQENGVTRISINPQTFNQRTLDIIGRKHSVQDIYDKFDLARNFDFDINMDLIAMLPGESVEDFKYSVDEVINLQPENITVHTLALKRGSNLKNDHYDIATAAQMAETMIQYSQDKLLGNNYMPYYMYKQKYVSGNLENIGYCKPNTECIYNIDIMEENHTILACGAGGISKLLYNSGKSLERLANPKGLDVYLSRSELNFDKRDDFFEHRMNKNK